MNSEIYFGIVEEACKPLDCGVVPEIRILRDSKGTLCIYLEGKLEVNEFPRQGSRSYHVPLALDALKRMTELQLGQVIQATRASLSQALTLES